MHASVHGLEERRALRLVCRQSRALVDGRISSASAKAGWADPPLAEARLLTLTQSPWRLLRLELGGCGIDAAGAAALAAAAWPGLLALGLSGHRLGNAGVATLAAAHWPLLQHLNLNAATAGLFIALGYATRQRRRWQQTKWTDLRGLHLRDSEFGDAGVAALVTAAFPRLEKLDIRGLRLTGPGMAALAGAAWPCLEELVVSFATDDEESLGIVALAEGRFPSLKRLCLDGGGFSDDGWAALAAASWPGQLQKLELNLWVYIHGLAVLAASAALAATHWPALQELTLLGQLTSEATAALAEAHFPALLKLDLSTDVLGDIQPLGALLAKFPRLQSLNLRANNLSGSLAEAEEAGSGLFAAGLPHLRELDVSHNYLTAADVAALAAAAWPWLEALELGTSNYDGTGAGGVAFVGALCRGSFPELRRLGLWDITLNDAGASALALGRWPRLYSLDLSDNEDLSADGVLQLLQGVRSPGLRELDLLGTGCCHEDAAAAIVERVAALRPELSIIIDEA